MTSRSRIVRTYADAHPLAPGVAVPDAAVCRRLQETIRRHLSPPLAALLAEPAPALDGAKLDWLTPLAGQATPLTALPVAAQRRVRRVLDERVRAIRQLARRLQASESEADLGNALLQATAYPGDETVFVVAGQPVLTFWGYGVVPPEPSGAPEALHRPARRARWPWAAALMIVLSAAALAAAFYFGALRWPPWGPDYAALLAAERAEGERLRQRWLALQTDLAQRSGQCALQSQADSLQRERALFAARLAVLADALRERLAACAVKGAGPGQRRPP